MADWNLQKSKAQWLNEKITDEIQKNTNDVVLAISGNALITIATAQQVKSEVNTRLNLIAAVNEKGFKNVTNAIEEMGAAICGRLDTMSSQLESMSSILKRPIGTQVAELYEEGCLWELRGKVQQAINKFESALKIDSDSFECNYKLGLLWLNEKCKSKSPEDFKKANEILVHASDLADGILKTDPQIKPILANCLMFTSQSFYNKVLPKENYNGDSDLEKAIFYALEAISHNSKLPQPYYFLARYYSLQNKKNDILIYLNLAIKKDRLFFKECLTDLAFDNNRELVNKFLAEMAAGVRNEALDTLLEPANEINKIGVFKVPGTVYQMEINELMGKYISAGEYAKTNTYFGDLEALKLARGLKSKMSRLIREIETYESELRIMRNLKISSSISNSLAYSFAGICYAFMVLIIPICFIALFWGDPIAKKLLIVGCLCTVPISILIGTSEAKKKFNDFVNSRKGPR